MRLFLDCSSSLSSSLSTTGMLFRLELRGGCFTDTGTGFGSRQLLKKVPCSLLDDSLAAKDPVLAAPVSCLSEGGAISSCSLTYEFCTLLVVLPEACFQVFASGCPKTKQKRLGTSSGACWLAPCLSAISDEAPLGGLIVFSVFSSKPGRTGDRSLAAGSERSSESRTTALYCILPKVTRSANEPSFCAIVEIFDDVCLSDARLWCSNRWASRTSAMVR
jgi:hypothetical protein